jgi:N-acetyl-alpha-D-muramate 1-phosphate uridylyltransferase
MHAMILAAGRGERMGVLTAERPKPLLEVGGRTLIERHLDALARAGVSVVVINLAFGGDLIRRALGDGTRWSLRILYSDEGQAALETGGGIIQALPLLGRAPFLLVSADVVTDFDFAGLTAAHRMGTLIMVANPTHHANGDFGLAADGSLSLAPPLLTYSGIALLDPALFAGWAPGRRRLRPILEAAIAQQVLGGARFHGRWIDVGTPERLEAARSQMRAPEQAGSTA